MSLLSRILPLCLVVSAAGCDVFKTDDAEGTRGRGARAFDPYASTASGAISLSLLAFNGCAILPNGEPVSRGTLTLPGYPDVCLHLNDQVGGLGPARPPSSQLVVTPGATYFLRELSVMDAIINTDHRDFADRQSPAQWMRKQSRFKALDWTGLTVGRENWRTMGGGNYQREVFYENAAWMLSNTDTLLLEVLDPSGNVRASQEYLRTDFLAENPVTGRTRVSWTVTGVGRPRYPGDPEPQQGASPAPFYHTGVKVSLANSTNPFKSFRMPDLTGEGVIRVTWSLMKDQPFLFPVVFLPAEQSAPTCYKLDAEGLATEEKVPCGFGLQQAVKFNKPANGKYYMPGETLDFLISLKDGENNGLHPRELMPSWNEYMHSQSNGLAYFNDRMLFNFRDTSSSESGFKVVGPIQDLKVVNGTYNLPYFAFPITSEPYFYIQPGLPDAFPGVADAKPSTRYAVPLSPDAKPGTYLLLLKGHRAFQGERLNRLNAFFFQVGQEQRTSYPNQVGNCQICHNGVNSLDNLHHGLSVDHVEACKTCHHEEQVGHIADFVHRLHMGSRKYTQNKANCTTCHLTRASALRPSLNACNSCHITSHGTEFFNLEFEEVQNTPNAYGNCANACHAENPPDAHILPGAQP